MISIDYEEPIIHTPFLMDPHYIPMINKDSQKMIKYDQQRRRHHSIEDDEEK